MANDQHIVRLFLQQREVLLSYIRALVRDPNDAEDLFQEVSVHVLSLKELPCDPEKFSAWCRGVARRMVLHFWRLRRRTPIVSDSRFLDALDRVYTEADTEADQSIRRGIALAECIDLLPERRRLVLSLRYLRRMTSDEIGASLKRSAAAVRQELTRIRHQLLDCVERRLGKDIGYHA
jgi:RNA polymerase sigma-70 factor, ECF subfamily